MSCKAVRTPSSVAAVPAEAIETLATVLLAMRSMSETHAQRKQAARGQLRAVVGTEGALVRLECGHTVPAPTWKDHEGRRRRCPNCPTATAKQDAARYRANRELGTTKDERRGARILAAPRCKHDLLLDSMNGAFRDLECRVCVSATETVGEWLDRHQGGAELTVVAKALGCSKQGVYIAEKSGARRFESGLKALGISCESLHDDG